jgi:hypothetical protein
MKCLMAFLRENTAMLFERWTDSLAGNVIARPVPQTNLKSRTHYVFWYQPSELLYLDRAPSE